MKLSRLLAASSVAALMAGAANAVVAIQHTGGTVSPGYEIAEEVDFAELALADADDGTYGLEVGVDGTIPPGQNLFLTVTVTNGKFTTALDGSEFTSGVTGAVVDAGGLADGNSVRYLLTSDGVATAASGKNDHVALILPIDIVGCGSLSFSVTEFETEGAGTPIEGGAATQATPSVTCVEAFDATMAPDVSTTTLDFGTAFSTFVVAGPDAATTAVIGDALLSIDTAVNIDMDGTNAAPAHVLGFEASVDFVNGDNIETVTATPGVGTTLFDDIALVAADSAALVGAASATTATDDAEIIIDISGLGPVAAQAVTVSGAALSLDSSLNLQAADPFSSADVQDLILNGQSFGPFDWVADLNGATNNIFRITGLSSADVPAQLILTNSNAGVNGVFPFTILASEINNGEVRINRAKIRNVVGSDYGTADVTFVLSTGDTLDIDRLTSTTATTAVVTPFGDGSNNDGPLDSDLAQP
jgi:hypothetical protein